MYFRQHSANLLISYPFLLFSETRSYFIAQVGLELRNLLSQPPKCWDYGFILFF